MWARSYSLAARVSRRGPARCPDLTPRTERSKGEERRSKSEARGSKVKPQRGPGGRRTPIESLIPQFLRSWTRPRSRLLDQSRDRQGAGISAPRTARPLAHARGSVSNEPLLPFEPITREAIGVFSKSSDQALAGSKRGTTRTQASEISSRSKARIFP